MASPTFEYSISTKRFGLWLISASVLALGAGLWLMLGAEMPAFIRFTCGPATVLGAMVLSRASFRMLSSDESFRSVIENRKYTQVVPALASTSRATSFCIDLNNIQHVEVVVGYQEKDPQYFIRLKNGTKLRLASGYSNPVMKILATLKNELPNLAFCESDSRLPIKATIVGKKLVLSPGARK